MTWPQHDIYYYILLHILYILNVEMSLCQTRKLWSFMHMVHSEDKPQHRTNWHSCTWTGLRPTDQPQNCKQAQHWTMGERTAGRGEGVSDSQKESKSTNRRRTQRITPENKKTTAMQNHDRERQEEVEEAAELWRLQETSARHKNNREEGESQTVITRQHEVLSNTLQGGNSERNEKNQRRNEKKLTQTEQTTAHSPLILQGCNSHTHWQPCFSQKNITALFGSVCFSQQYQKKGTFIRVQ